MTTMTETLYTRSIQIDNQWFRLQPGDQVDNLGDWCTVARLGEHAEDKDVEDAPDDAYCEGNCDGVIFFADDDCAFAFHVREASDEVHARFPVEVSR
jgi:hypothetical protein